jgi:large subunit ribosomal protein L2
LKKELKGLKKQAGRNNTGKITVRRKGNGHKKSYRQIKFYRANASKGITAGIEYDPNRNANIASIFEFLTKKFFYILAPKNLKRGDVIKSSNITDPKLGHSLPLQKIPIGSYIHNISTNILKPGQISRSAGTFSKIKEKNLACVTLELTSGKIKKVSPQGYATIGIVSNELIFLSKLRKAGQSRWLNKRPKVRGVAMNPIDHPHGGGEGKKSGQNRTP